MGNKCKLFDDKDSTSGNLIKEKDSLFNKDEIKKLAEKAYNKYLESQSDFSDNKSVWKVLIVDDDEDVTALTKLALNNFEFNGKKLQFFEADSGEKAKKILSENEDIALIFLGIVMKPDYDKLKFIKYIRDDLKNNLVHIVLRTRQAGYVPEKEIISNYRINFCQTKEDLTESKLHIITTSILNSYNALKTVDDYNKNLESIIKKRTIELIKKNEELKKAGVTKNKMLSIIAHDLVNPFHSLLGFSEIIKNHCEKFDVEKIKKFADIIYETSNNTYQLLSNLLEWSRTQTGKIQYKPKKILINNLIKNNILLLQSQVDKKSISLNYSFDENIYTYCDTNMINTVIRNLLSNGIKFTEKGEVKISAEKKDDSCIIIIKDTGIGIAEKKIKNLFTVENVSTNGTAGEVGTGIGLMLCCEFVKKNKGKILVESEVNKGSSFIITLPLFNKNIHA